MDSEYKDSVYDEYEKKINGQRFLIDTLRAVNDKLKTDIERQKEQYIIAVNDMARLKKKLKNCVCPDCGFGFEQE